MKKFIMILSAFAMIGAAVVGYLNKKDLDAAIEKNASVKAEVVSVSNDLNDAEQKRADAETKETQAKDTRNQAAAAVEESKRKVLVAERELETVSAELKKVEIEQKEVDLIVATAFPGGEIKSSEDLQMTLTMLKDNLTKHQERKTELNTSLGTAAQAKQVQVAKVKEEEGFQMQRAQRLALNGLVATVIAVNREWDFVMVNAGRSHGVSADSSLLVKRGNTRIARLRIVNLEDGVTVADIVGDSTVRGIEVQPGDKVIFESAQ